MFGPRALSFSTLHGIIHFMLGHDEVMAKPKFYPSKHDITNLVAQKWVNVTLWIHAMVEMHMS